MRRPSEQKMLTVAVMTMICLAHAGAALAAASDTIMLKAGEVADLGPLYWVTNCRSVLKGPPTVDVMEGPAELMVSIKDQPVVARKFNCAKPVQGGELTLSASKDVKTRVSGKLFLRINYPTKDGNRQAGREVDYTIFPVQGAAAAQEAK